MPDDFRARNLRAALGFLPDVASLGQLAAAVASWLGMKPADLMSRKKRKTLGLLLALSGITTFVLAHDCFSGGVRTPEPAKQQTAQQPGHGNITVQRNQNTLQFSVRDSEPKPVPGRREEEPAPKSRSTPASSTMNAAGGMNITGGTINNSTINNYSSAPNPSASVRVRVSDVKLLNADTGEPIQFDLHLENLMTQSIRGIDVWRVFVRTPMPNSVAEGKEPEEAAWAETLEKYLSPLNPTFLTLPPLGTSGSSVRGGRRLNRRSLRRSELAGLVHHGAIQISGRLRPGPVLWLLQTSWWGVYLLRRALLMSRHGLEGIAHICASAQEAARDD
jgi:hypothetical protein